MMKKMVIEVPENVKDEDLMKIQEIVERVLKGIANDQGDYWSVETEDRCVAVLAQTKKIFDLEFVISYLHEIEEFIISTFKKEIHI